MHTLWLLALWRFASVLTGVNTVQAARHHDRRERRRG
jgi:hypothetical protein